MISNGQINFCRRLVYHQDGLINFDGRPYLPPIFASTARNLVLRTSRQVEKSTFLALKILYLAVTRPGIQLLYVCPRQDQTRIFIHQKLMPLLDGSPFVREALLGSLRRKPPVTHMRFTNGSQLLARAAYRSADAVRGISSDVLAVDEFQDIAAGDLPVLQETLSHSRLGYTILTGTPKHIENHLEAAFARSTANEWTIPCPGCGESVILDEHALGPHGIVCRHCQQALDASTGRWVPRNPNSAWGDGFWINHLMVPWLIYDEILERQSVYDLAKFKNEVLGLSTTLGDHVVTRAELESCCSERPMIQKFSEIPSYAREHVIVGIDWGGGGASRTVVTVGWMRPDFVFEVGAFHRFRPDEDSNTLLDSVANVCRKFRVRCIAADGGGNGHHLNRLLLDRLNSRDGMYAILYSLANQEPRQEGQLWKWTVDRSATIGTLFSRVKKGSVGFPQAAECGSFLDEFACELVEYDDANRTVRYTKPDSLQDDALHATNYALLVATRDFHIRSGKLMDY